jgi:hypothetical protein
MVLTYWMSVVSSKVYYKFYQSLCGLVDIVSHVDIKTSAFA